MMILVVGSTGLLGGSVARKLVGTGRSVSAVVRDPSSEKARALESAGAEIVSGDLKDRAGLEKVIRGADAVVCTASATLSRREGDSIDTIDVAGVRSLIEVAEAAAVGRFVFISISPNVGDDFPLATAKRAAEERLRASRLDYVVLQPSYFAEVWFSPVVGFDVAGGTVCVYGTARQGSATSPLTMCRAQLRAHLTPREWGGALSPSADPRRFRSSRPLPSRNARAAGGCE